MAVDYLKFYKYQGTGNDFIIINQLENQFELTTKQIAFLCDRRMGIGADGLMLLRPAQDADFHMIYYNSNGCESTMCGNGGRCISSLFFTLTGTNRTTFTAIDGYHDSHLQKDGNIALLMSDVEEVNDYKGDYLINTGSPHYIKQIDNVDQIDIERMGAEIRYSPPFEKDGINVNFLEIENNRHISVRTYERGVEGETLSCGTGVTACALATHIITKQRGSNNSILIKAVGGNLEVRFDVGDKGFSGIWLIGPAQLVYEGNISI